MTERSILLNALLMIGVGVLQIAAWGYWNQFISWKLGRTTLEDIEACIEHKVVGPALVRMAIMGSTALLIYGAGERWL